jgi:hypothetical protein
LKPPTAEPAAPARFTLNFDGRDLDAEIDKLL